MIKVVFAGRVESEEEGETLIRALDDFARKNNLFSWKEAYIGGKKRLDELRILEKAEEVLGGLHGDDPSRMYILLEGQASDTDRLRNEASSFCEKYTLSHKIYRDHP
ncbi:MAG TPA: hypothetical protein VFE88_02135 [Candidatus Nanoarchaeia archaeon]|nr:hypothetical protein [Candidatus Nanoarchaeia archaeon]